MVSTFVEVFCSFCRQSLGDEYRPGDGVALFREHIATAACRGGVTR